MADKKTRSVFAASTNANEAKKVTLKFGDHEIQGTQDGNGNVVFRDFAGNVRSISATDYNAGNLPDLQYQVDDYEVVLSENNGEIKAKVDLAKSEKFISQLLPYTDPKLAGELTDDKSVFKSFEEQTGRKLSPELQKVQRVAQDKMEKYSANKSAGVDESAYESFSIDSGPEGSGRLVCMSCGKGNIDKGSNFCPGCGAKL